MRKLFAPLLALGLAATAAMPQAVAQSRRPLPNVSDLLMPATDRVSGQKYSPRQDGEVDVIVRLADADLASFAGAGFKQARVEGTTNISREAQIAHVRKLKDAQRAFADSARALYSKQLATFQRAINGIAVRTTYANIDKLKAQPGVVSVRPIGNYELDLSETVPYIGAKAVQDSGVTGAGVTVAVLDSGIDYTHKNLGGAGTLEAYAAAYGDTTTSTLNTTRDGLFPTAKVIGGFDFVGEAWPDGDLAEDDDPIDLEGHGTHVADIIAGESADGTHKGVAPGAKLIAVKVCSAVDSACSGIALIKAADYILDPNGDGDMADAVDIANLSLGSSYGQVEDDLSFALGNASQLGVVVIASAGNSADRPFIVGSPSMQKEVISVAQTTVPSAQTFPLAVSVNGGAANVIRNTNTVDWAPVGTGFTGTVIFAGRGCYGADTDPDSPATIDDPYPAAGLSGKVALIDRGACSASSKVSRAQAAGAIAVIIANNAGGDPPSFSLGFVGGGLTPPLIPTVIVTQGTGNSIKSALNGGAAVIASLSAANAISLRGAMVASSSRGPSFNYTLIKPEIGAPGASISAIAGSGDKTEAFGGTSGAAPMVSGSAALLLAARPRLSPRDVKALLVNTADDNIQTNPATQPGVLAPITRIGGGEVRVNKAVAAQTAAWASDTKNPTLSFGYHAITADRSISKRVTVKNYSKTRRTYTITPKFRYANDAASGAITPVAPTSITVSGGDSRSFSIRLDIDAEKLPDWPFFGGGSVGVGPLLQTVEFDGYLEISDSVETIHVPWHILPHKSNVLRAASRKVDLDNGVGGTTVRNTGVATGYVEAFALTGVSPKIDEDLIPGPGDNFVIIDLKAVGVRLVQFDETTFGLQFAIASNGARAHPTYPAAFEIRVDSDRDGDWDYIIYNRELGTFASSGTCVVGVVDIAAQTESIETFCAADLKSGNMIMTVSMAQIGLPDAAGTNGTAINFRADAFDSYFTGLRTDQIENWMFYQIGNPRYLGYFQETLAPSAEIAPAGGTGSLMIQENATEFVNPATRGDGVLLMYIDAAPGKESEIVRAKE
jgi:minor extracellular serine protease Vpr